mgnify:FL=1
MKQYNYYSGELLIIEFELNMLEHLSVNMYLKQLKDKYQLLDIPVLILCPLIKKDVWKKINYTNIYLTCDAVGMDYESEFRKLLTPKPLLLEQFYYKIKQVFFRKKNTDDAWWLTIPEVSTISI